MQLGVIIAAGGIGSRMGLGQSKQLHHLAGKPVLAHTILIFDQISQVRDIIVAIDAADIEQFQSEVAEGYGFTRLREAVAGGSSRVESVKNALAVMAPELDTVLIHDGARPLFVPELLKQGMTEFTRETCDGIVFGLPVTDTIKETRADGKLIAGTPDRGRLWQAQTPQVFSREAIEEAYKAPTEVLTRATDDSFLVERAGGVVKMVAGSRENIKLTEPADLVIAEAILKSRAAVVEG
jgi:2-C-methyl-D-erythritol 4-phosphate cytidylyltransferase